MKASAILALLLVLAAPWPVAEHAAGQSGPPPDAAALDTLLRTAVAQKRVPYVVGLVATARGVAYEHAEGIGLDAIFAIASMTKPVTSIALMQLVEAGKVKLDSPAATYVPELAKVRVTDKGSMRPPRTPLTIRHLLTHTSGFGYEFMNRDLYDMVAKGSVPSQMAGGDRFLEAPLLFDPGTRWEYGIGTDWIGRIVERVSGQSLEAYFRQHVFDPLGMKDSFFVVPAEKQSRVAKLFHRTKDGGLAEQPPQPRPASTDTFYSGGGGLFSTARDYLTLTRAVLAGGQLGGMRILKAESIALMGQNQIGTLSIRPFPSVMPDLATDNATITGDLDKFGFGFALNSRPSSAGRGANTLAWAGIFNTFFWIDREKQVAAVLMTQMLPGLEPGPAKLLEEFDRAVYAAGFGR